MIYVGVDIAKLNHFASAISSDDEVLIEPFKFTNDADGFQMLVSKLISLKQSPTASSSVLNQRHTMATNLFDIELLDSQLNKIEEEMTDIMKFNDSVIMTIPGISYINGGMILGEIGNIHRFSSSGKLLCGS